MQAAATLRLDIVTGGQHVTVEDFARPGAVAYRAVTCYEALRWTPASGQTTICRRNAKDSACEH